MSRAAFLRVLLLALLGSAVTASLIANDAADADHVSQLLLTGEVGPSVDAVLADMPDADLAPDRGHDGQQSDAIARAPMHLDEAAEHLDRPRYRLQRPLMTAFASVLAASVVALDFNGTRTLGPLLVLGILALGTPTPAPQPDRERDEAPGLPVGARR